MDYSKEVQHIKDIVANQNQWRKKECINLIASENAPSPLVEEVYQSDFSHRYAEGDPGRRFYNGVKYVDEIESMAIELGKQLFNARHCNIQPVSGTAANLATIAMFGRIGDTIISNSTANGGHITHNKAGAAGLLGISSLDFPTTEDGFHIDADKANAMIERLSKNVRNHLSLLIFGCSMYLFPQPVKEIAPTAKANDLAVMYDMAHVCGLIAGKQFQDPLKEGADAVATSTHKTFPGPQGGAIFSNMTDDEWSRRKPCIFPATLSNYHLHRFPAFAMACLEMLEFGQDYAKQTVKNAQLLGAELDSLGFDVKCADFGYSKSHQVVVDVSKQGGGKTVGDVLEKSNIIVNKNLLPGEKLSAANLDNPAGIRIGVQEMTRYGMKDGEVKELALLFKKAVLEKKDVKKDAIALRSRLQECQYTFKN